MAETMSSPNNPEHENASYDDVNTRSLFLVGLLSVILVFAAIVAVQTVYFRYEESEFQRKFINSGPSEADKVVAAQKERLTVAAPLPASTPEPEAEGEAEPEGEAKPAGAAEPPEMSIPIAQAMAEVLTRYQTEQARDDTQKPDTQKVDGANTPDKQVASES